MRWDEVRWYEMCWIRSAMWFKLVFYSLRCLSWNFIFFLYTPFTRSNTRVSSVPTAPDVQRKNDFAALCVIKFLIFRAILIKIPKNYVIFTLIMCRFGFTNEWKLQSEWNFCDHDRGKLWKVNLNFLSKKKSLWEKNWISCWLSSATISSSWFESNSPLSAIETFNNVELLLWIWANKGKNLTRAEGKKLLLRRGKSAKKILVWFLIRFLISLSEMSQVDGEKLEIFFHCFSPLFFLRYSPETFQTMKNFVSKKTILSIFHVLLSLWNRPLPWKHFCV